MNIFAKRPLSLILCIILCGFSLFAIGNIYLKSLVLISGMLLFFLSLFHIRFKKKIFLISSIALLLSVLLSFLYFDIFFFPTSLYGEDCTLTGTVVDSEEINVNSKSIDFKVTKINGEHVNYKVKLYLYGKSEINVGNVISVVSSLSPMEKTESFDFKTYYTARGFSASCSADEFTLISNGTPPISYKFKQIRDDIFLRAKDMSDNSTAGLLSALLLGDRDNIQNQLELDFRRIGIIHILSLGGMHLAILTYFIDRLLSLLRVNKKVRVVISCLFSLFFMFLTGFPITVFRAGVMLIISSLLTLLAGNKDSITSMFIGAVTVMVLQPYAAMDLGFWLSVLSTLGILTVADFRLDLDAEKEKTPKSALQKIKDSIYISLAFSLFAICASIFITSTSFEYISTLSIPATLIISPIIEIFLVLGVIMLLVGNVVPLAPLVIFLNGLITDISAALSMLPFSYTSVTFPVIKILSLIIGCMFIGLLIFNIRTKKSYIACMTMLLLLMLSASAVLTHNAQTNDAFTVASENKEDKILIISGGQTLLFDCSSHKNSAGYSSVSFLSEEHIANLDCYMVANYSDSLPDMLKIALSRVQISNVALPKPLSNREHELYSSVENLISAYRTDLFTYDNSGITFANYEILPAYSDSGKNCSYLFATDNEIISYLSSGILDEFLYTNELLYTSNSLIFGGYGVGYDYQKTIDDWDEKLNTVISFDENIYLDTSFAKSIQTKLYVDVKKVKLK